MRLNTKITAVIEKFVKPVTPVTIVLSLLYVLNQSDNPAPFAVALVLTACATILWFGWSWMRRALVSKWIGVFLAVYLGINLGLIAVGITLGVGIILFVPFLVLLPFVVYDLFFRQPYKGRSARTRVERRNVSCD